MIIQISNLKGGFVLNKYRKLLSNTVLLGISSFGSKILIFLLVPFYTGILSTSEFSTAELILQTGNLLMPMVSVGMANSMIRFGLDNNYDKRSVFVGCFTGLGFGSIFLVLLYFPLTYISDTGPYTWLICLFVFVSIARNLCSQFVRALQATRLYAVDGILNTGLMLTFTILFLGPLELGIAGYVGAVLAADFCSGIFLWTIADLGRYFKISKFKKSVFTEMLKYSIPLIPATMLWWVTTYSDRRLVTMLDSASANGLYGVAYRIPGIITVFSVLFTEAWQLSAITEGKSKDRSAFFSNVFLNYQAIVFCASAGLIYFCQLAIKLIAAESYYLSWKYVPILVIATAFSCFVNFIGSVYMVEKRSTMSFLTMLVGAVANVILNIALIPKYGPNGAAFATFACYIIIFVLRAVNCRRYLSFNLHIGNIILNTSFLFIMTALVLLEINLWQVWSGVLLLLVLGLNITPLLQSVNKILRMKK